MFAPFKSFQANLNFVDKARAHLTGKQLKDFQIGRNDIRAQLQTLDQDVKSCQRWRPLHPSLKFVDKASAHFTGKQLKDKIDRQDIRPQLQTLDKDVKVC